MTKQTVKRIDLIILSVAVLFLLVGVFKWMMEDLMDRTEVVADMYVDSANLYVCTDTTIGPNTYETQTYVLSEDKTTFLPVGSHSPVDSSKIRHAEVSPQSVTFHKCWNVQNNIRFLGTTGNPSSSPSWHNGLRGTSITQSEILGRSD